MSTSEAVARLVKRFEEELVKNPSLYHSVDIERVRTEEWQVKRFILDQPDGDESKAFEALTKALQWKKSFGLHDRNDQYYPKEMWELNSVEINGKDNEGRVIQWEALKNQKFYKEIHLLTRQFFAHNLERVDRAAGEAGFVLVSDANGAGISNVDLEFSKYKISIQDLYPMAMKVMYIVDQPWLLNALVKIVIGLMSDKLRQVVQFAKGAELAKDMDVKYIPVSLKGTRDKSVFPDNLLPMDQLGSELGLDEKFLDYFYKNSKLERTNKA